MERISRQHTVESFRAGNLFVAEVKDGETFLVETNASSRIATGAINVLGAEPGDTLRVTIHQITFGDRGEMWVRPGRGIFGDHLAETLERDLAKVIPLRDGKGIFNDAISFPLNPMVGVVGVAPRAQEWPTRWPGLHGGNLDCKEVRPGSRVFLPVSIRGAGLGIGDIHAAMGDGESMLSGVEIAGEVTAQVALIKGRLVPTPMVETDTHVMVLFSSKSLDMAAYRALDITRQLLQDKLGVSFIEAGMLLSAVADVIVCQLVNPLSTVRVCIAKAALPSLTIP